LWVHPPFALVPKAFLEDLVAGVAVDFIRDYWESFSFTGGLEVWERIGDGESGDGGHEESGELHGDGEWVVVEMWVVCMWIGCVLEVVSERVVEWRWKKGLGLERKGLYTGHGGL
jgi:hypothetical protein